MFYDYHTHTSFSDDSQTPAVEMVEHAKKLGLAEIVLTDHYDPDYPDQAYPFTPNFTDYYETLNHFSNRYQGSFTVKKGIEIGIQNHVIDECRRAALDFDYDYIIGSFHCCEKKELYKSLFFEGKTPEDAYERFYRTMYNCLLEFKDYCCLGHFNIVDRYAPRIPEFSVYSDIVEAIMKMIIEDGKGIELNTSSFRYGLDRTNPSEEMLRLYRSLGGEIIVIGSDAHKPSDIAHEFDYAQKFLRSLGFRYLSVFSEKKPSFIMLD